MKICVVGAGNIGLVMAGTIAAEGEHEVSIYTRSHFDSEMFVFEDVERGATYEDLSIEVFRDLGQAIEWSDYILCTYPAFLRKRFIEDADMFLSEGDVVGFVPGYGGAELMCANLIKRGVTVFGFQRVPFISRQNDKKIAKLLSRKSTLFIAALPKAQLTKICEDMGDLFSIPTRPLDQYLSVSLVPSNPLLHLTGLYNVFNTWNEGDWFDEKLKFYEEWNDDASRMLLSYDEELQTICTCIPLDLRGVVSLREYYESETPELMTAKLKSIEAFKVVEVPLIARGNKYYPDFRSRMFVEDFPYGIAIIKEYALLTGVDVPTIDSIMRFYSDKTGIEYFDTDGNPSRNYAESGAPGNFGFNALEDIVSFYCM